MICQYWSHATGPAFVMKHRCIIFYFISSPVKSDKVICEMLISHGIDDRVGVVIMSESVETVSKRKVASREK